MESEQLQKLGFNKNESKSYLALLHLGESQAGKISKKAQINRTNTYDALERLMDKGLVTYTISANKKVFKPVNPDVLLDDLKQREKITKELLPGLNAIYHESKKKEDSMVYKGKKGIKSVLDDVLKYNEYLALGSSGKFSGVMKHEFVLFQNMKQKLKIKSRVIESESSRKKEFKRIAHAQFKYIPDEFASPTTTIIYSGKVAILVWGEIPMATVIKSDEVYESYSHYFELLWKNAKR